MERNQNSKEILTFQTHHLEENTRIHEESGQEAPKVGKEKVQGNLPGWWLAKSQEKLLDAVKQ